MPQVEIFVGGRSFEVACQAGEEPYLLAAAALLDAEAAALSAQIGRMPEARMLLMAGLMLADKTAGLEERLRDAESQIARLEGELAGLRAAPAPEPVVRTVTETVEVRVEVPVEKPVEVPVVPEALVIRLAELAADSESLAERAEALR